VLLSKRRLPCGLRAKFVVLLVEICLNNREVAHRYLFVSYVSSYNVADHFQTIFVQYFVVVTFVVTMTIKYATTFVHFEATTVSG